MKTRSGKSARSRCGIRTTKKGTTRTSKLCSRPTHVPTMSMRKETQVVDFGVSPSLPISSPIDWPWE